MAFERVPAVLLSVGVVLLVAVLAAHLGFLPAPWSADRATVTVVAGDGTTKAVVDAEVADTPVERYVGLSDHDSLADGEGMLFVHGSEDERTYVMREMDFAIDVVFVGADGEITAIRHARAPDPGEDGEDLAYSGRAKWVLEVPRGYADERGIEAGDAVAIEYERS
ncbi:DUF192 domain-containing protein [Salinilacihabitans rarus]|uniref:DUF192 domain-containing protein n=1 Tax=Salinilacihabitans rarus TaxID=2961596 RepID=UPI0020C8AF4A|nr:DUF192 domain-containing protein [Salinilacihabitans rarus]